MQNDDSQRDPLKDLLGTPPGGRAGPNDIASGMFPGAKASNAPLFVSANGKPIISQAEKQKKMAEKAGKQTFKVEGEFQWDPDAEKAVWITNILWHNRRSGRWVRVLSLPINTDGVLKVYDQMLSFEREVTGLPDWACEYYNTRALCPKCSQRRLWISHKKDWAKETREGYSDQTPIECSCGWKGVVDNLVGYQKD